MSDPVCALDGTPAWLKCPMLAATQSATHRPSSPPFTQRWRLGQSAAATAWALKRRNNDAPAWAQGRSVSFFVWRITLLAHPGMTYDRHAVETWFVTSRMSPLTGQQLPSTHLIPNVLVRGQIARWRASAAPRAGGGKGKGGSGSTGTGGGGSGGAQGSSGGHYADPATRRARRARRARWTRHGIMIHEPPH